MTSWVRTGLMTVPGDDAGSWDPEQVRDGSCSPVPWAPERKRYTIRTARGAVSAHGNAQDSSLSTCGGSGAGFDSDSEPPSGFLSASCSASSCSSLLQRYSMDPRCSRKFAKCVDLTGSVSTLAKMKEEGGSFEARKDGSGAILERRC